MNPIIWPTIVELALVTYRSMNGIHFVPHVTREQAPGFVGPLPTNPSSYQINDGVKRPPLPSELLPLMLIFGLFGIVAESNSQIGSLLGWGVVLATALVMVSGGQSQ